MRRIEQLPAELLWDDAGHLGEIVVTALADAQDAIVPAAAHGHLRGCDRCMEKLGEAVVLSMDANDALLALALALDRNASSAAARAPANAPHALPETRARRAAMRPPRFAISAALALAALGAVPFLMRIPQLLSAASFLFARGIPILAHMFARFAATPGAERAATLVPIASALVLVGVGALIARYLPRSMVVRSSEEGASV